MVNRSKDPEAAQEGMDMIREAIEINQDKIKNSTQFVGALRSCIS